MPKSSALISNRDTTLPRDCRIVCRCTPKPSRGYWHFSSCPAARPSPSASNSHPESPRHHARRTKRTRRKLLLRGHTSLHLSEPTPHTPSRKPASGSAKAWQSQRLLKMMTSTTSPALCQETRCRLQRTLVNIASERGAC